MDWQEQQQQFYKQQQAKKKVREAQEAAERNRKERERFAEQQRLALLQDALRESQQATKEQFVRQQQAEAAQRLTESLKRLDEQRQAALSEAALKLQQEALARKQGSPIETMFFEAFCEAYPTIELKRQYPIGKYRVDFAHVETKTVIELDGYIYHSAKRDINRDYQRQQEIEEQGWRFVRFTGGQIFTNVASCVQIAQRRILKRISTLERLGQ